MPHHPATLADPLKAFPEELNVVLSEAPIAYLPFGTIEWHGPHLPLGVDVFKIEAFVARATAITGGVVFPITTWNRNTIRELDGYRHEGMEHVCRHLLPGNYHFLTQATFEALVEEMVDACLKRGFKVVCVWSGHNAMALAESIPALQERLQAKYPSRRLLINSQDDRFLTDAQKADLDCSPDHAGKWETSIVMAAQPELVRLDRLAGKDPTAVGATDNGAMEATADLGRRIIESCAVAMAQHLLKLLEEVNEVVAIPQAMPEAGIAFVSRDS